MLAAAADRDSALSLFQLVLKSVDTKPTVEVSEALKKHVVEVLTLATQIAADPKKIGPETPAEAIELALMLRGHAGLTEKISRVRAFENLHGELAKELLKSLRAVAA